MFQGGSDFIIFRGDSIGEALEKSYQAGKKTTLLILGSFVIWKIILRIIDSLPEVLADLSDDSSWFWSDEFSWILDEFVEGYD